METSCGDVRSRGLLACVIEADGRVLCNGIKSVVQSVKLIDISDFTLLCVRPELGVIFVS